LLSAWNKIDRL
jgi:translation initiation factor 3 subunit J